MGLALCRRGALRDRIRHRSQYPPRPCPAFPSRTNLLGKDRRLHHLQVQGQCLWDRQRLYPWTPFLLLHHKGTSVHGDSLPISLTRSIQVVMLGYATESLEIGDLPIVSFDMRATHLFQRMRNAMKNTKPVVLGWKPKPGSGWQVGIRLFKSNTFIILIQTWLAAFTAVMFYAPPFFLRRLVAYLETDPLRLHRGWGVVFALGLFVSGVILTLGGSLVLAIICFEHLTLSCSIWSTLVHQYHDSPGQVARTAQFHLVFQDVGPKGSCFDRFRYLNGGQG